MRFRLCALIALAVGALTIVAAPAVAEDGPCTTSDGVTVIVDATALGGSISQRCAPDAPTSGLEALRRAGFSWSPVSSQPAMVCRINGRPGPSDQSCVSSPPADAYWGYYRARRGGDWKYSSVGAASAPFGGGVEGWVFITGGQRPPGLKPPAVLQRTDPAPTTSATAGRPSKATQSSSKAKASDSPSTAASSSAPAVVSGSSAPPEATSAAVAGDFGSAPPVDGTVVASAATDSAQAGGGSAISTLFGVAIGAGLVIAAVVMGIRRRRSS